MYIGAVWSNRHSNCVVGLAGEANSIAVWKGGKRADTLPERMVGQ